MVSAGADGTVHVWDVETGNSKQLIKLAGDDATDATDVPVNITFARSISVSYSGNLAAITAHKPASLIVFDLRVQNASTQDFAGKSVLDQPADAIVYSHLDDSLIVGNHNGELLLYETGSLDTYSNFAHTHGKRICDLQVDQEQGLVISASSDKTAQLHNTKDLNRLKTYKSGRPVNSAAISPKRDHIVLGGGEEAMGVTQTAASSGQFEAKLYHMIYEDEFAKFKGHFGPINSLCFDPTGNKIITGGEDGYIRVQDLGDTEYTDFEFDF